MPEMEFKKLFKESPSPPKPGAPGAAELPPAEQGPFARKRMLIGGALLFLGITLFFLQGFTASEIAQPHIFFYILWAAEAPPAAEKPGEQKEESDPVAQYKDVPSEDFSKRFTTLLGGLKPPEGIKLLPVELLQLEARYLVPAGSGPASPDEISARAYYRVVKIGHQDAGRLYGLLAGGEKYSGEGYRLGPHPYIDGSGPWEIILPSGGRRPVEGVLPEEASALSGFVVDVTDDLRPNAALIVSAGEMTVAEFSERASLIGKAIADDLMRIHSELKLLPSIASTDMLHRPLVFYAAVAGELLFLLGGFLLFFHLIAHLAGKPEVESRLFTNLIRRSARLITGEARLYAVVVGLVLFCWISGSAWAYIDPSGQRSLIQWFQSQFAGGSWPLGTAGWAYSSGNIILAAAVTFAVNFLQGTVIVLTLPSLIPIAAGFLFNALRTEVMGLSLAPTTLVFGQSKAMHLPTILLEMQAYMLAAFVSVLLPLALWKPERFGAATRWEAYKKIAAAQFLILPLAALILLVGAVYEAFELIVLVQLLR
jgi:hypothetical protein